MRTRWKALLSLVMLVVMYLSGPGPAASAKFSAWSTPVLVSNVNSEFADEGPAISRNGRSLYFGSSRPGGHGGLDLWVSQRRSVRNPWGPPVNLGATVNTSAIENVPAFSPDGHWMFFNSDRAGGSGLADLCVSYRRNTRDDFSWGAPVNLGPQINSPAFDLGPSFLASGNHEEDDEEGEQEEEENEAEDDGLHLLFFGSNRPGGPGLSDLYVSSRNSDGSFGPPALLPELSSPFNDQRPSIRADGLEIFFFSNRPESAGGSDLWVATRDTLLQVWNTPENLGPVVNGPSNDIQPYVASRGQSLYFASNRPGGPGLTDLYVTTRSRHGGKRGGKHTSLFTPREPKEIDYALNRSHHRPFLGRVR